MNSGLYLPSGRCLPCWSRCAMPIKIELLRDGRVILQTYTDPLDMMELIQNVKKLQSEILDHATRRVHTLTDATGVTKLPSNLLSGGAASVKNVHPMSGEIVIVTSNNFINTMSSLFGKIVPQYKVTVWKTMEDGWAEIDRILAREDASS